MFGNGHGATLLTRRSSTGTGTDLRQIAVSWSGGSGAQVRDTARRVVHGPIVGLGRAGSGYQDSTHEKPQGRQPVMSFVLWLIAAVLVIVGIFQIVTGDVIVGIVLIVVGCLVGPGGYSIFRNR
jgi:hypothetical protein